MKNCTPLWREVHVHVKMYKTLDLRTTSRSCDVKRVHAVVARSKFPVNMYKAHHVQTTFENWNVQKVHAVVARSTRLWHEAYFVKNWGVRTTFWRSDVEKVYAVVAQDAFPSQKCQKLSFLDGQMSFLAWHAQGILHLVKSEQNVTVCSSFNYNHQYTTLHYTTLHYTTLHYTTLDYIPLHCTTLQHTTLHSLRYNTFNYTTLQLQL